MSSRSARISSYTLMAALCLLLPISETRAATVGCSALPRAPSVIEIDQGLQQELRLPVGITRAAVGDPKIADVHPLGNNAVLVTAMGAGATSLSLWTACAGEPRQTMVFVRGRATADLAGTAVAPSLDAELLHSRARSRPISALSRSAAASSRRPARDCSSRAPTAR